MLKRKENKLLYIGIIVVCIGLLIGIIPKHIEKTKEQEEQKKIEDFIETTSQENKDKTPEETYIMVLEIPKIHLKRGIYKKESNENTIEKNIEIMKESYFPSDLNGNVILEAHNGNSNISYFKEIDRLEENDSAYLYYQGTKYHYIVKTKYEVKKNGEVNIKRDPTQNTLSLITCKKNTDEKQIVIILYLEDKKNY